MKEIAKKLFLMQVNYGGIPEDIYHFLPENERRMLTEERGRFFLSPGERKKLKVVLTGGVFDILHIGHIFTLEEAKKLGDVLVVAVAKDEMIRRKKREPIHNQDYRKIMVSSLRAVDAAISGFDEAERMVEFIKPDVIVYGYDQKEFLKPEGIEVVKVSKKIDEKRIKTSRILDELGL